MWNNESLTSLDLSRNHLTDFAGSCVARMLRRNAALKKLELDENELGPRTVTAFGDSLSVNKTLVLLSLESNPHIGSVTSGIAALSRMLGSNTTLNSLSLWRCGLTPDCGAELAQGLLANDTLVFLDLNGGNNNILMGDKRRIVDKLEANLARNKQQCGERRVIREREEAEEAEKRRKKDEEQKQADTDLWMEEQSLMRAAGRREAQQAERERIKAEAVAKAEAERRAKEEKEKAEAAAKGKGKKGKKGKKK